MSNFIASFCLSRTVTSVHIHFCERFLEGHYRLTFPDSAIRNRHVHRWAKHRGAHQSSTFSIPRHHFDVHNRTIGLAGGNVKKKVDILVHHRHQKHALKRARSPASAITSSTPATISQSVFSARHTAHPVISWWWAECTEPCDQILRYRLHHPLKSSTSANNISIS